MIPPFLRRLVLAVAVLALAAHVPAAETAWTWGDYSGDKPPEGWDLHAGAQAKPTVKWERGELAMTVEPNRSCHLDRVLKNLDGTDEAPLRIDCSLVIEAGQAVDGHPVLLALQWSGALVGVGLGDGGDREQPGRAWRNRAWLCSISGGKAQKLPSDGWFYSGPAPAHVRLVLTSHTVTAYSSADGWSWTRLGDFDRAAGFAGPPERLLIGRGWTADKDAKATLDGDPPLAQNQKPDLQVYRFRDLRVSTAPANVPAALMKNYEKKDSRDDTVDLLTAAGNVKQWQVLGPLPPAGDKPYGPEIQDATAPLAPVGSEQWKPFSPGESPTDRIINLSEVLKGGGADSTRFAAATFTLDAPRVERFLFDGSRDVRIYVDGREIAQSRYEGEVVIDRLSATAQLGKGEHRVVVRIGARQDGRALFTLRHENGDALFRIALLKRLAIDFPDDSAAGANQLEIARLWESLGYQREAANSFDELAKMPEAGPEQIDQALIERARLHHELRDEARVAQDVDELIKRWGESSDPVSARLKAAHLWERLDQPEKAAAALDEAAGSVGADVERQLDIGIERARVHQRLNDGEAIIADLRATIKRLPESDPRRSELAAALAVRELWAKADPSAELAIAIKEPSPTALRIVAAVAAARGDAAGRLAALKRLAALGAGNSLVAPRVAYAEALAASDVKAACEEYRAAIAAVPSAGEADIQARLKAAAGADAKALAALRAAYIRTCIAESEPGRQLLAEIAQVQAGKAAKPLPSQLRFQLCGPFDNSNWRCYDAAFVEQLVHASAGRIDTSKPIEGKAWQSPRPDAWAAGFIDLMALLNANNSCALLYAEVDADADVEAPLSMGADDGLVLWVNGEKVHEDRDQRGLSPDSIVVNAKLKKGTNSILAMVQQGGGAWSFQFRIAGGSAMGDVASALRSLDERPDARADVARQLAAAVDGLARSGRYPQALAVAHAVLRGMPDADDVGFGVAVRLHELVRPNGDGVTLTDLPAWFDASASSLRPGIEEPMRQLRLQLGDTLASWGVFQGAADLMQELLRSYYDPGLRAQALRVLGDTYRRAGYARTAAAAYAQAERAGYNDEWFLRDLHERMWRVRSLKGEKVPMETSFDANALLRTAERAADGGDLDRAVASFQRAIDDYGPQLGLCADGRQASVSAYATARLRALGADGAAAYRKRFDDRAKAMLAEADAAGGADGYEHVAAQYPLSSSAALALDHAADAYRDIGAWSLAVATLERVLRDYPEAGLDRNLLLAKAARAAVEGGDTAAFQRLAAQLSGQVTINGKPVDAKAWAADQAKLLPAPAAAPEITLTAIAPLATFAIPANDIHDLRRITWHADESVVCRPTIAQQTLFLHTLDQAFAIDLATGALKWRDHVAFPTLRAPSHAIGFGGIPESQTAVWRDRAVARVLRGGTAVLEARDPSTGVLSWSTEGLASLSGMTAVSSPVASEGRVYAIFTDHSRNWVGSLSALDGRLLWITQIIARRPALPMISEAEISIGGSCAPPTVVGRDLYVASDLGSLIRLDAGSGAIAWISTYPRALIDPAESGIAALAQLGARQPTRVVVDDDRLYIAPRDSLSIFCFARGDGSLVWTRELMQCRGLAGVAGDAQRSRLIQQGPGLDALDARTGATLWKWLPRSGDEPTVGEAVLTPTQAVVATHGALYRVALADGATVERHSWKELGWDGPIPGNLALTSAGLVGVGNGVATLIGGAKPAQPASVPGGVERDVPIAGATLPAAAPGSPLAAAWRVGGDVSAIERPEGCADGECFVRFSDSMARIDVPGRRILWRAPISSDVRWTTYTKDMVIAGHRFGLSAYDRASGQQRWYADLGQSPMESLRDDVDGRPIVIGETVALSYTVWWARYVEAFSLVDGHRLGRFEVDGGILGATERDGHIFTVYRRDDGIRIDERDATKLGTSLKVYEALKQSDRDGMTIMPDNHAFVVHGRNGAVRFDLAEKQVKPYPLAFFYGQFYREDGKDLAMVYTPKDQWVSAVIDPATDQALFQEVVAGGGQWENQLFEYHLNHGKAARIEWDRKGRNGVFAKTIADAKEVWYVPGREGWNRRYHALVMLDKYAVALSSQSEGVFTYDVIDIDSGAVTASGRAPGWPEGDWSMPATAIAGHLVYGTRQGLFALVPTTPEAAADPPVGGVSISTQAMSRLAIVNAPGAITIDGHLDDWKGIEPVELWQAEDVRPDGSSSQPPRWAGPRDCAAGIRLCWDAKNVYAAVRVLDDRHRPPAAGSSLITGDSVLIAIDPQEERFRGSQPYVVALAVMDGKPMMTTSGGLGGGENQERPQMRASLGVDSATYEIAIPWGLLRGDPNHRPGDQHSMRVGVLVVDRDSDTELDALEMGYGLAGGFDQTLWRPCLVANEKDIAATGMAFSLCGGRATWGHAGRLVHVPKKDKPKEKEAKEEAWLGDEIPKGATPASDGGDAWTWVKDNPPPGATQGHQSAIGAAGAEHQHYFQDGPPLKLKPGDAIFAWIYLDPANPPEEVMLQWNKGGSWEHRAYWGANKLGWGADGSEARHYMGPLPKAGGWVRLEIPPSEVGLE